MLQILKRPIIITVIILLVWIVAAQSCMKFRISDVNAQKKFRDSGLVLKTFTIKINGSHLHYAET